MTLAATVTEVSICNMALSSLGRATIVDFANITQEEILCKLWYPIARNSLLEQAPWTFAEARWVNLAPLSEAPPFGFRYAYLKPTGALKIWEIEGGQRDQWRVVGDKIYANMTPINVIYTDSIEDPTLFTPMFVLALAKWLESIWAIPFTGKLERQAAAFRDAQFWIAEAMSSDGQQGTSTFSSPDDLGIVRL